MRFNNFLFTRFLFTERSHIVIIFSFQRSSILRVILKRSLKTKQNTIWLNLIKMYFLHRKEVIHPHVPVGIPCYDLTPITSPTLGASLLAVRITTSGITSSHGLTGGVYKPRERIHRSIADLRLLAIPASWSRVADFNPNWDRLFEFGSISRYCISLYRPL